MKNRYYTERNSDNTVNIFNSVEGNKPVAYLEDWALAQDIVEFLNNRNVKPAVEVEDRCGASSQENFTAGGVDLGVWPFTKVTLPNEGDLISTKDEME